MKKLFLLLAATLIMSGCNSQLLEDYRAAGEEKIVEPETTEVAEEEEATAEESEEQEEELDDQFIVVDTPGDGDAFNYYPLTFEGRVSEDTVKIQVKATGGDAEKGKDYKDDYFLKDYVAGTPTFTYRTAPGWNNLAEGQNSYEFIAHHKDGASSSFEMTVAYEPPKGRASANFDGCKNDLTDYQSYPWFEKLLTKFGERGMQMGQYKTGEACYAENANTVVFIYGADYCSSGTVYRYYTDTGELQGANFVNNPGGCTASITEFLKREGDIIPMYGWFGDAGCMGENHYNYNFIKNEILLVKSRSKCEDEAFTPWRYRDPVSGKSL